MVLKLVYLLQGRQIFSAYSQVKKSNPPLTLHNYTNHVTIYIESLENCYLGKRAKADYFFTRAKWMIIVPVKIARVINITDGDR